MKLPTALLTGWMGACLALATPAWAHPPAPAADLSAEAVEKLQALLRIDTSNPPGREAPAARLVAGWLEAEGIPTRLYESAPGRLNLVARLKGSGAEKPLMLLGHLDVVTAEPTRWKQPPFSGGLVDGRIWGRGALDMKGLIVMQILAFLELKRRAVPLGRDVILCLTADEEAGGDLGAGWLLANHPEEVACSEILNEGGSGLYTPDGKPLMGIQTAERGSLWVRVLAHGQTGHGSQHRPDSAPRRLIRALARLEARPATYEVIPETRPMLQTLAGLQGGVGGFVLGQLDTPWLRPWLAPRVIAQAPTLASVLAMTVNTTVLSAGSKVNVVPGEAAAEIDMRMLPGHTVAQTLAWLKDTLADDTLSYTVLHSSEPSTSPPEGGLYRSLVAAVNEALPGVPVTPIMTPGGGTDSAYFRRLGVKCYGFMPILASVAQITSIHGDDEHISVEQLASGTRMTVRAVALATSAAPARRSGVVNLDGPPSLDPSPP